jgi:hypothetical protein
MYAFARPIQSRQLPPVAQKREAAGQKQAALKQGEERASLLRIRLLLLALLQRFFSEQCC